MTLTLHDSHVWDYHYDIFCARWCMWQKMPHTKMRKKCWWSPPYTHWEMLTTYAARRITWARGGEPRHGKHTLFLVGSHQEDEFKMPLRDSPLKWSTVVIFSCIGMLILTNKFRNTGKMCGPCCKFHVFRWISPHDCISSAMIHRHGCTFM
jgi:hypothetical protein